MNLKVIEWVLCHVMVAYLATASAFYVPGVAPVEFKHGDSIDVKAVKMTSSHTQLPYEYYSLPFCRPKNGTYIYKSENLGEVLRGDRIVNTRYEVRMAENITCRLLCHSPNNPMNWNKEESQRVTSRIEHEYNVHLLVDNLPCATKVVDLVTKAVQYRQGYKLGYQTDNEGSPRPVYINNHLKLILYHHSHTPGKFRVVGFEVEARSVASESLTFVGDTCHFPETAEGQVVNRAGTKLFFTYSVEWRASNIPWASRWDIYLRMSDVKIHWFSIINSLTVVFFLFGILALIMVRALRRDIARYNTYETLEEAIEETGWKLVHGDVFRPPRHPRLFAAVIGSGIQIFFMALYTIVFATLGMLSPSSRGALMNAAITLYVLQGVFAGYFSARVYKTLKGREWKRAAFLTGTLYPGVVFSICFFLNFFIWGKHSSSAVPFPVMLWLMFLLFGVALPLVYLGYYFGYRKQPFQHPVRTNQIPRQIPDQRWYMNTLFCSLMAGVLPFGAVFIELFFIFSAIWENQFYYMFGFLFLVFIILVVSVSQISIVMVYFQLCGEDYRWWWRSLAVSGGTALYVFGYSMFYFYTKLEITEFIPTLLYVGYTAIIVVTFWILTGTIGFFAAYFFIRKIYAAVKID